MSFGLYVGILCSGHWTVEKSCFCFLNLEIGLFDQIHFPSPTLQPGPSGYFFWIWAGLGRVLKKKVGQRVGSGQVEVLKDTLFTLGHVGYFGYT